MAGFEFPIDKLGCINAALAMTGDDTVSVADDGSDEWNTASPAYERALGYMMESGDWGYASLVVILQPSPTPPQDTSWDTAYPIPPDCVHVIWVKINEPPIAPPGVPGGFNGPRETLYDFAGTPSGPVIVTNALMGEPSGTPSPPLAIVTLKYISNAAGYSTAQAGTPTFVLALQYYVMSAIYRGLHEDPVEAANMEKTAEMLAQRARFNYDRQKPKRQIFNSRMSAARLIRRPWPPVGLYGWGGNRGGPG